MKILIQKLKDCWLDWRVKFMLRLLGAVLAGAAVLTISEWLPINPIASFLGFLLLLSGVAFAKAFSNKKIVTVLLVGSLMWQTTCYAPENDPPPQQMPDVAKGCLTVIALAVIVVVLYVVWSCTKKLPPSKTPPPKPPPAGTNTNANAFSASLTLPMVELKDANIQAWDTSMWTSNNLAFNGPDGKPYTVYFTFTVLSGSTPTFLSKDCEVSGWVSDTYILTVMDGVTTNLSRLDAGLHFAGDNRKAQPDPPMRFYSTQRSKPTEPIPD